MTQLKKIKNCKQNWMKFREKKKKVKFPFKKKKKN